MPTYTYTDANGVVHTVTQDQQEKLIADLVNSWGTSSARTPDPLPLHRPGHPHRQPPTPRTTTDSGTCWDNPRKSSPSSSPSGTRTTRKTRPRDADQPGNPGTPTDPAAHWPRPSGARPTNRPGNRQRRRAGVRPAAAGPADCDGGRLVDRECTSQHRPTPARRRHRSEDVARRLRPGSRRADARRPRPPPRPPPSPRRPRRPTSRRPSPTPSAATSKVDGNAAHRRRDRSPTGRHASPNATKPGQRAPTSRTRRLRPQPPRPNPPSPDTPRQVGTDQAPPPASRPSTSAAGKG